MKKNFFYPLLLLATLITSCYEPQQKLPNNKDQTSYKEGTFGYDMNFLIKHDSVVVLKSGDGRTQVIVSPKYQAKVFTSTAEGNEGVSFGWVNYKAFNAAKDLHINVYGGENRLWLGPEGGKFSLFFKPGSEMVFDNWKTPAPIDTEPWSVTQKSNNAISLQKEMKLLNYHGTQMQLSIARSILILERQQVNRAIEMVLDTSIKVVGYQTVNKLTNTGNGEWTEATGMPCMWLLDMFKPTPATVIVVPFIKSTVPFNEVATTNYFGEIPADRLQHTNEVIYFKADGKSRGKLGVAPGKAQHVAGSYDIQNKILTAIIFDVDATAKYLNQEWNTTKPSFSGDAVNAYNDGPLANGTQLGPFYEIESVSPAAFLQPGKSLFHQHSVFHFMGSEQGLNEIAQKLFGVSLDQIKKAF